MTTIITIPQRLESILTGNPGLHGAILSTLTSFHPWIRTSGLPFFPGYTDHSDKHISEVLSTASSLISDEARRLLTPADVAVLILSTLLHDAGMHLTEDGFRHLVGSQTQHPLITGFKDEPWQKTWTEFVGIASRFDGRKLTEIFGDSQPIDPRKVDINNLNERDRLLVGEFIRRHHARLAHEIALGGVPGPAANRIQFINIPPALADLSGLVARSHNLSIRETYDYLKNKYNIREFQGVHAIFLMAVLRISDYIQVQSERAESQLLRVKHLRSPVSKREWSTHDAIRDIQNSHDDPEALYIDALPPDIEIYTKLTWLIKDIQAELDSSWAALGEVYGRVPPLNELGLTIRRVRSSLDDTDSFSKKIDYVPAAMSFSTAGTDLLKLLVGPLYGNVPGVGVRELIQNSVDACRELVDWRKHHARQIDADPPLGEIDVLVEFEKLSDGSHWVTIRDAGIGMTIEVIKNYFLRAGASFRSSDAWRKAHENEQGRSRVLRGGRFGIGALAAFLIGSEIEVTTRHITQPANRALKFTATLDTDALNIRHTEAPFGTTIRIRVDTEETWKELTPRPLPPETTPSPSIHRWENIDWYCLDSPKVTVRIKLDTGTGTLEARHSLPQPKSELPPGWYRIEDPDYDDIHWTNESAPAFACNGIFIQRHIHHSPLRTLWNDGDISSLTIHRPNLSIFDAQGLLPLDLQRTSVTGKSLSFDKQLISSIIKDYISFILVRAFTCTPGQPEFEEELRRLGEHPLVSFSRYSISSDSYSFAFTRAGFTLLDKAPFTSLGVRRLWIISNPEGCTPNLFSTLPADVAIIFLNFGRSDQSLYRWFRFNFSDRERSLSAGIEFINVTKIRAAITTSDLQKVKKPRAVRKSLVAKVKIEREAKENLILSLSPDAESTSLDFISALEKLKSGPNVWMAEWILGDPAWKAEKPSPVSDAWTNTFIPSILSYSADDRLKTYRTVHQELARSIAYQKDVLAQEIKDEQIDTDVPEDESAA
ncbi:hypothetical protein G4177_27655 [Corallococcus sp. ZKHCc1 1396]|uniref:HD-CE domain-containing protein n=1 Tax=Corallococcus soli TaxID=2710757 RepID=A0ABR9PVJ9_9BACT|nr:ATP-binding protein [Corallococcus soli]MBE4751948.1 hypothetical protein [Corallococcus soli]